MSRKKTRSSSGARKAASQPRAASAPAPASGRASASAAKGGGRSSSGGSSSGRGVGGFLRGLIHSPVKLATAGAGALALGLLLFWVAVSVPGAAPGDGSHAVSFEVPKGSGAFTVARELKAEGLIASEDYFKTYLRLTGQAGSLKVGTYRLNDGMSVQEIAEILTEGRVELAQITIPEGWNNRQIGDYLTRRGYVDSREAWLELTQDPAVLARYEIRESSTEGYLFPDTYHIPESFPAAEIQELMLERFFEVLDSVTDRSRHSAEEIRRRVILASIVEREAVRAEERPMMSQVFLNRLDKGMRLESCATIQYLLPEPRSRLYERHLQIASPYNTYRNSGLPPGPISNPGRAALHAAFHPRENEFLFFVLTPDGSHHFSKTYDEHLQAKRRYIDGEGGIPAAGGA